MEQPRRIPIHRSLNRQHFLLGGERELVLYSGLIAMLVAYAGMSWISSGCGAVFWMICLAALRRLAKADPQMSKVYQRHVKYRPYYPATSDVLASPSEIAKWKP